MWRILDQRHAEYPAEHNVGHLYHAKPSQVNHYRSLDPSNSFNPGIGSHIEARRLETIAANLLVKRSTRGRTTYLDARCPLWVSEHRGRRPTRCWLERP